NGQFDAFVYDRKTGIVERVSVDDAGREAATGVSHALGSLAISADGMVVAFVSDAPLVPDDTNHLPDVFVRDRRNATTRRVSVGTNGTQANGPSFSFPSVVSLSDDGRLVAFDSEASNLIPDDTNGVRDVFVHDRLTGDTVRASNGVGAEANGTSVGPVLSGDG